MSNRYRMIDALIDIQHKQSRNPNGNHATSSPSYKKNYSTKSVNIVQETITRSIESGEVQIMKHTVQTKQNMVCYMYETEI